MSCLCSSLKGSPRTMSKYAPDNGDNWGGSPILPDDWTAVVGGWTKTGFWFSHSAERGRSRPEQEEGGRAEREGEGRERRGVIKYRFY